jgi:outer membrane receptor protein involved in Fe transport
LGAGGSTEEPSLETGRIDLLPPGALNPDCGSIAQATKAMPADVNVGSSPAANLTAETASDLEFGYEHRFGSDATLALRAYDMNVKNRIVTGDFPAGAQLPTPALAPLLARIGEFCGRSPDPAAITFTLGRAFNVATARVRGVELEGRVRISSHVAFDYGYDVQSSTLDDLPASAQATDPTLVNGVQVFGVPLHKANLGIDALTRGGLELRLDGHAVGPNNPQQLPGYAYADASLAQALSQHVTLSLSISNLFGSHAQRYGLVGAGLPYATNSFNSALGTPFAQPFNERYGLPPTCVTLSASLRL